MVMGMGSGKAWETHGAEGEGWGSGQGRESGGEEMRGPRENGREWVALGSGQGLGDRGQLWKARAAYLRAPRVRVTSGLVTALRGQPSEGGALRTLGAASAVVLRLSPAPPRLRLRGQPPRAPARRPLRLPRPPRLPRAAAGEGLPSHSCYTRRGSRPQGPA